METKHQLSWGRARDSGRAERFGLSKGGSFDMAQLVKLPPTQLVRAHADCRLDSICRAVTTTRPPQPALPLVSRCMPIAVLFRIRAHRLSGWRRLSGAVCTRLSTLNGWQEKPRTSEFLEQNGNGAHLLLECAGLRPSFPPVLLSSHGVPRSVFTHLCVVAPGHLQGAGGKGPDEEAGGPSRIRSGSAVTACARHPLCRECILSQSSLPQPTTCALVPCWRVDIEG